MPALDGAGDATLSVWNKVDKPVLLFPPENLQLVGWRDPYIFERGGNGKEWGMLMGSGLKGKGGAVLIYRSLNLYEGAKNFLPSPFPPPFPPSWLHRPALSSHLRAGLPGFGYLLCIWYSHVSNIKYKADAMPLQRSTRCVIFLINVRCWEMSPCCCHELACMSFCSACKG